MTTPSTATQTKVKDGGAEAPKTIDAKNLPRIDVMANMQEDITAFDPATQDPEMDYRWVNKNPAQISKRLRRGWQFVYRSKDKVRKLFEYKEEVTEDDLIYNIDTVLMKIPKDLHAAQVSRVDEIKRARLGAPKGMFRDKAARAGVKINDGDDLK